MNFWHPRSPAPGLLFVLLIGVVPALGAAATKPPKAALATAHPLATEAGFAILSQGGNAFDAAIAISATLAVVEPYGSGLGGGGFWLLHRARDGFQTMIDGRERAPLAAHRDLYLDAEGRFVPELALDGPLAAGIPGMPAALCHLAAHYGRLALDQTLAPAIRIAREGFEIDPVYARLASWRLQALRASPAAAAQFLVNGEVPAPGYRLRQPALAETLSALAGRGCDAFYAGPLAERLVKGVRAAGGIWTREDLEQYRIVERPPIVGNYRNWRVVSAAPPSSGGVLLIQMLNMLASLPPAHLEGDQRIHTLVEIMRRAYRDRARYLGDPDQVDMPLARLTDPNYAAGLIRDLDPDHATPSRLGNRLEPTRAREGHDTTHFSVLDREGNRVAATLSINYPFGSGFVAPGTGVLLNDEMDDFAAQPGVANVYGLIGGEANAIAPGKRMLSSMSPTFLEASDGVLILGTPGGSRIITMVLQGILAAVESAPLAEWVSRPRIHHQYLPDRIQFEPDALADSVRAALAAKGHRLDPLERPFGNMQAVFWDRTNQQLEAASDPRGLGEAGVR